MLDQLTCVSNTLPLHFTYSEELYDVFTELLRPLPLPVFRNFLATLPPEPGPFPPHWHIALLINMLLPFLAAPPRKAQIFNVTQNDLIKHYLPHAANANSAAENAKMSLLVEHILFYMFSEGRLEPSIELTNAVEKGIRARAVKATGDARRRGKGKSPEEQAAKGVLDMSAERIRVLLGMLDPATSIGGIADADASFSSSQLSDLTATPSVDDEEN
ncbi:uncharacterized protein PV09_04941 [Verruconis gallopava]|uniref:Uncharacterized protein n=1 Tax=Verruconis gallopava TaxID=253628 RepID=A0A0D2ABF4_9PEZI|nr:uncharacterized protein PV09_04941 [Verruconis gallopava]KIW04133.1 hypothetical protein PV09_04941 [Verruconis gallopava]